MDKDKKDSKAFSPSEFTLKFSPWLVEKNIQGYYYVTLCLMFLFLCIRSWSWFILSFIAFLIILFSKGFAKFVENECMVTRQR